MGNTQRQSLIAIVILGLLAGQMQAAGLAPAVGAQASRREVPLLIEQALAMNGTARLNGVQARAFARKGLFTAVEDFRRLPLDDFQRDVLWASRFGMGRERHLPDWQQPTKSRSLNPLKQQDVLMRQKFRQVASHRKPEFLKLVADSILHSQRFDIVDDVAEILSRSEVDGAVFSTLLNNWFDVFMWDPNAGPTGPMRRIPVPTAPEVSRSMIGPPDEGRLRKMSGPRKREDWIFDYLSEVSKRATDNRDISYIRELAVQLHNRVATVDQIWEVAKALFSHDDKWELNRSLKQALPHIFMSLFLLIASQARALPSSRYVLQAA